MNTRRDALTRTKDGRRAPRGVIGLLLLVACRHGPADSAGRDSRDSGTPDTDAPDTDLPDSGPPDSDSSPDTDSAAPVNPFACTTGTAPADIPEPATSTDGHRYFVLRLDTTEERYVVLILPDTGASLYTEGAPVLVTAINATHRDGNYDAGPTGAFTSDIGVIEVQPLWPGWTLDGTTPPGTPDDGGPESQATLADAVRFSAGEITTVEGWALADLVDGAVCNRTVFVMGASASGATVLGALASDPTLPALVAGIGLFEVPSNETFFALDLGMTALDADGATDSDGDGIGWDDYANPRYAEGDCDGDVCAVDYSLTRLDDTHSLGDVFPTLYSVGPPGVLYSDNNGNGRLDLNPGGGPDADGDGALTLADDFVYTGYVDLDTEDEFPRYYHTPGALTAAMGSGTLTVEDWPVALATVDESAAFYDARQSRPLIAAIAPTLPAWFQADVMYSEVDHASAVGSRPQIRAIYEGFREQGLTVRYNTDQDVADCFLDASLAASWTDGPDAGVEVAEADMQAGAISVDLSRPLVRMIDVLGLIQDVYGVSPGCP